MIQLGCGWPNPTQISSGSWSPEHARVLTFSIRGVKHCMVVWTVLHHSGSISQFLQVASCCQCWRLCSFGEKPHGRIGGRNNRALCTTTSTSSNVGQKAGRPRPNGVSDVGQAGRTRRSWAQHTMGREFHGPTKRGLSRNLKLGKPDVGQGREERYLTRGDVSREC